jgi:hypothetical protein
MHKPLLAIAIIVATSQALGDVRVKQAGGHTILVSGLYNDSSCTLKKFEGRIIKREFNADAETLSGVVIEHRDGTRDFINVSIPTDLDMATRSAVYDGLQRLTKIGRTVRGQMLACGAAGRVENVETIQ